LRFQPDAASHHILMMAQNDPNLQQRFLSFVSASGGI
jgi:hypothetical protein